MDGEDVVHVYSGILRSREKEQSDAIAMMRMDLEMIVPSDVHQRERDKYHVMSLIRGTQNVIQMNSRAKQK